MSESSTYLWTTIFFFMILTELEVVEVWVVLEVEEVF